jgi:hypothetical protein
VLLKRKLADAAIEIIETLNIMVIFLILAMKTDITRFNKGTGKWKLK